MIELEILGYKVLLDDEDYERVSSLSWWLDKKALVKQGHWIMLFLKRILSSKKLT